MSVKVRCKCGVEAEVSSQGAVRCPACGRVIHVVVAGRLHVNYERALAEPAKSEPASHRTRELFSKLGELLDEQLLQRPFRIVAGVVILVIFGLLLSTLGVLRPRISEHQEDFDRAMSYMQQGKPEMARPLFRRIVAQSPQSVLARRAQVQLSAIGDSPAAAAGAAVPEPAQSDKP